MSLRHGLLALLAEEPQSGYDLAGVFSLSMANVWPAQHSQIYPELAKLLADGLIAQVGEGARGRKVYQTTPAGLEELRAWLRTEPDYSVRYEALLRVFCLSALPRDEVLAQLAHYREQFADRLEHMQTAVSEVDWAANTTKRSGRLAIEFGRRFFTMQLEWADWAAEQVAAGALEDGGPIPARLDRSASGPASRLGWGERRPRAHDL
jgi:DNA-binding PadR family transcriptional regulator